MNYDKFRPVVSHLIRVGKSDREIHDELRETYQEQVPSFSTIQRWIREFKFSAGSLVRGRPTGAPRSSATSENIDAVRRLLKNDRKLSLSKISETVNLPYTTVQRIVTVHLGFKKVDARWVPKTLSSSEKDNRVACARAFLDRFEANWHRYRNRIITEDETWVSFETDEGTSGHSQWCLDGEKRPERPRIKLTARKVMLTVFWDCKGILLLDFLPTRTSFTSDYYIDLLVKLKDCIDQNRSNASNRKFFLLHDNARPHSAEKTRLKVDELGLELIQHPPYSPDLAPSDFFLFRNFKNFLRGKSYRSRDEVIAASQDYFESKDESYYTRGIDQLPARMKQVLDLSGEYIPE